MNMFDATPHLKKRKKKKEVPLKANKVIKTVIYSGKPNRDVNKLQGG